MARRFSVLVYACGRLYCEAGDCFTESSLLTDRSRVAPWSCRLSPKNQPLSKSRRRFLRLSSVGILQTRPQVSLAIQVWACQRQWVVAEELVAEGAEPATVTLHPH